MARGANELLLAELERLRTALDKMDARIGTVQSRLAVIETRLTEADGRRGGTIVRETSKRLH